MAKNTTVLFTTILEAVPDEEAETANGKELPSHATWLFQPMMHGGCAVKLVRRQTNGGHALDILLVL